MSRVFIFLLFLSGISSAKAAALTCSGTIDILSYHAPNKFMIKLSSMNTFVFFCNPDAVWSVPGTVFETGPDACKMMYSTFLTAKAQGKSLESVYFDGDQVPASCNSWASWSVANIRHYVFQ